MKKLTYEQKNNLKSRGYGSIWLALYAIVFLACTIFADARHPDAHFEWLRGYGFAQYIPLWGNSLFAFAILGMIIFFNFKVGAELNNCFVKSSNKKLIFLIGLMIMLPQFVPFFMILFYVYYGSYIADFQWNTTMIIYFVSVMCSWLLLIPYFFIVKKSRNYTKFNAIAFPLIAVIITLALIGFFYLAIVRSWTTIILILIIPICTDTFAYFTGIFFGKHKLAPVISPKKTWEGAFGGLLGALIVSVLLLFIYGYGEDKYFLQSNFFGAQYAFTSHIEIETGWWWMWVIIILFVCILSAVFGDLLFSLFKRKNDIKDFSSFLLGHGGILDRFDSYIIEIAVINFILLMIAVTSTLMNIDSVNRIFNVAALPIH